MFIPETLAGDREKICKFIKIFIVSISTTVGVYQYNYFKELGIGHVFRELTENGMPQFEAAKMAKQSDWLYGLYGVLGWQVFLCLMLLFTIKWICERERGWANLALYLLFMGFGIFFSSLSAQHYGNNPKFPEVLLSSCIIYFGAAILMAGFSGILLVVLKLIEASFKK